MENSLNRQLLPPFCALVTVLALGAHVRAEDGAGASAVRFPVGLGMLKIVGLDEATAVATEEVLTSALRELGAEVAILKSERTADRRCLKNRRCLIKLAAKQGLAGLFLVSAVRIGPTVQLDVKALRADTGTEIRSAVFTPNAAGFPDNWDAKTELTPMSSAFDDWPPRSEEQPGTSSEPGEGDGDTNVSQATPAGMIEATEVSPAGSSPESVSTPRVIGKPATVETQQSSPFLLPLALGGGAATAVGAAMAGYAVSVRGDAASSGAAKATAVTIGNAGLSLVAIGAGAALTAGVLWLME